MIGQLRTRATRRGITLVLVLASLLVATLMLGAALRTVRLRHEQATQAPRTTQAEWLAAAGLSRAQAQLRLMPDYQGETWLIPPEEFGGAHAARVIIRVEPVANMPEGKRIVVQADWPVDSPQGVRRAGEALVKLTSPGDTK